MKRKISLLLFIIPFLLINCSTINYSDVVVQNDEHRAYLYGESHGIQVIMQKEIELWEDYYKNQNFRHLFLEIGYCDAQMLNLWMQTGNDVFLDVILDNFRKTVNNGDERAEQNRWFYNEIKSRCPQTIFHGTDVQHQWQTGEWYKNYLKSLGSENAEEYSLALESIKSCELYYVSKGETDEIFRENYMVSNFKREFDALPATTKIMGIYGSQHTCFDTKNFTDEIDNMATQLREYYLTKEGDIIFTQDISKLKNR